MHCYYVINRNYNKQKLTYVIINNSHTSHSTGIKNTIPATAYYIQCQHQLKILNKRLWNIVINDANFKYRITISWSGNVSWINLICQPSDTKV